MTRPQVLMARNTEKIPIMFIISPAFIWKKREGQSQYPQSGGIRTEEPLPRTGSLRSWRTRRIISAHSVPGKQAGGWVLCLLERLENWASGRRHEATPQATQRITVGAPV